MRTFRENSLDVKGFKINNPKCILHAIELNVRGYKTVSIIALYFVLQED